jgi:hypothetical protein
MQEAGGLATYDILRVAFHGYLACHNRLAADIPAATRGTQAIIQSQRYGLNHPQAVT